MDAWGETTIQTDEIFEGPEQTTDDSYDQSDEPKFQLEAAGKEEEISVYCDIDTKEENSDDLKNHNDKDHAIYCDTETNPEYSNQYNTRTHQQEYLNFVKKFFEPDCGSSYTNPLVIDLQQTNHKVYQVTHELKNQKEVVAQNIKGVNEVSPRSQLEGYKRRILQIVTTTNKATCLTTVDTGASICITRRSFVKHLKIYPCRLSLNGLGGHAGAIGCVELEVQIGPNFKARHPFIVIEDLPWPVLLGNSFFRACGFKCNYNTNEMIFGNEFYNSGPIPFLPDTSTKWEPPKWAVHHANHDSWVELPFQDPEVQVQREMTETYLTVQSEIKVPASSHYRLRLTTIDGLPFDLSVIEPVPAFFDRTEILVPNGIAKSETGECDIWVNNMSKKDVQLTPGTKIAKITEKIDEINPEQKEHPNKNIIKRDRLGQPYLDQKSLDEVRKQRRKEFEITKADKNPKLTKEQAEELDNLLIEYSDCFSSSLETIGRTTLHTATVRLKEGAKPVFQYPYRSTPAEKKVIEEQIKEMEKAGVIEQGVSRFASRICLVKKRNGEIRFCIDYRQCNQIIEPEAISLPRIDELIQGLTSSFKYYTNLDLHSFFWQIGLDDKAQEVLSFISHLGTYRVKYLPFGMLNSPRIATRLMSAVLAGGLWGNIFVYLDDVLIANPTWQSHLESLRWVLEQFRTHNLTLKLPKCSFAMNQISYLGHTISEKGIAIDDSRLNAIRKMKTPKTQRDVKAVLGCFTYWRKFIYNFAHKAQPLIRLLSKDVPFVWDKTCDESLQLLKETITSAPILAKFDETKPLVLTSDTCDIGYGGWIGQLDKEEGKLMPIAFASRTVSRNEKHLIAFEHEVRALVYLFNTFRNYIAAAPELLVRTDSKNATYILNTVKEPNPTSKFARYQMALSMFPFKIVHCPASQNKISDALSRYPVVDCTEADLDAFDVPVFFNQPDLVSEQLSDDFAGPIIKHLTGSKVSTDPLFVRKCNGFKMENDLLYYRKSGSETALVIPKARRLDMLISAHDEITAGHLGRNKTMSRLQRYWWPKMRKDIGKYIDSCQICASKKTPHQNNQGPLQPIKVERIFGTFHVDVGGPFPESDRGNKYYISAVDSFSKLVIAKPIPANNTEEAVKFITEDIIATFSCPSTIITDRGTNLTSEAFNTALELMGIKHNITSSYNPQANGQIEVYNAAFANILSSFVSDDMKDWDRYVKFACFAMNSTVQESTRTSAFKIVFGTDPVFPIDTILQQDNPKATRTEQLEALAKVREKVKEHISQAQAKMKERYDKKAKGKTYEIGSLVRVFAPQRKKGVCPKLSRRWFGIYKVAGHGEHPNTYEVQLMTKGKRGRVPKTTVVNVNRMKPAYERVNADFE